MESVIDIFNERKEEVNVYFNYIKNSQDNVEHTVNKILKSNLILMLYNLVESSIANSIEEIHTSINSRGNNFDELNDKIKLLLLKQLKNTSFSRITNNINGIAKAVILEGFSKNKISNGNIDNDEISKISNKYGFSNRTTYEKTKSGACLKEIKNKRNDLAHGTFSFTDVGKDYSVEDLESKKEETINYLEDILDNIKVFIADEKYKR